MNPLPKEWAIKHRADACAVTRRPFALGEYFYTLLFHETHGYRPPANACYVLAAMLERKRVLKQVKTEHGADGRVLIYEHGATGDVFIVPEPQLRLDELENVQNEVAQLLQSAAQ